MDFKAKVKAFQGEGAKNQFVSVDGKRVSVFDSVAQGFTAVHSISEKAQKRLVEQAADILANNIHGAVLVAQNRCKERILAFCDCEALAKEWQRIFEIPGSWSLTSRAACPTKMTNSYGHATINSDERVSAGRHQTTGAYTFYLNFAHSPTEEQVKAANALGYTNRGGAWAFRG